MESNNDSGCVNEKLTIVLTNASIYLFEIVDESKWNMIKKYQSLNPLKPRPWYEELLVISLDVK